VYFPMRTANNSATLIGNIFIDNRRHYTIKLCINGLSDHATQLITQNNFSLPFSNIEPSYIRNINKNTIAEFQLQLNWEQWDNIFGKNNVNDMFNNFSTHTWGVINLAFWKKKLNLMPHIKWITKGIKISCKKRRNFYCADAAMI